MSNRKCIPSRWLSSENENANVISVDCILNPNNYSFPFDLMANFSWNALMSSLACNDRASFMLLFLVSRKPFVLTFLWPDSHDLRASKLKKFYHVFLVCVIIEKREVCNSFPRCLFWRILENSFRTCSQVSHRPNPRNYLVAKTSEKTMYPRQQPRLDMITTRW